MHRFNRSKLESLFEAEGLLFLGVATPENEEEFERFQAWLREGRHGGMHFLENHRELRRDPRRLLADAKSVLMFGLPYDQGDRYPVRGPAVAQYGRLRDYHKILRERGQRVFLKLAEVFPSATGRLFVDSAPVLERALAARTERGFIGKNTCFIHPIQGSFLLLAGLLTSVDFEIDAPAKVNPETHLPEGGCGACKECQRMCPTGALDKDYTIDSRRCLAYWTIEHRGPIPEEFWPWLKDYYFGCDICQLVCPFNMRKTAGYLPQDVPVREYPGLLEIATMDQAAYETYFGGTPLTRAKRGGLKRNALIAMAVTTHPDLDTALEVCESESLFPLAETAIQIRNWRRKHESATGRSK